MARTMDISFLRSIKKEQSCYGNSIFIKQQHTMLFSSLFSDLKTLKLEEQQNNNDNPSSVVVTHDDVDDDRVCLHFSVGGPSCPSCSNHQQLTNTNKKKKRKRPQQQQQLTLKNKKPRIINWDHHDVDYDDHNICLHLWLGSSSCIPTCLHQTNNNNIVAAPPAAADHHHHDKWEIKKVLEMSDVSLHLCRLFLKKELAQKSMKPNIHLHKSFKH
ncbi:hypothetical protein TSUD_19490 [Trifolium subterraneum]|uniref:Uncharacterized protein n=1 Tax=Trifolium subterraneum TaxID=3900 RepID=A0A2Z6NTM4_TRISU|nr:hypothetical protein TSUD_19490 [Trifolium subterraneum]